MRVCVRASLRARDVCVDTIAGPAEPVSHARSSPVPDHPHPLAQSASAPGSHKIFYDSLFSTLQLAALIQLKSARLAILFIFIFRE